jgi:hypothetical protein
LRDQGKSVVLQLMSNSNHKSTEGTAIACHPHI